MNDAVFDRLLNDIETARKQNGEIKAVIGLDGFIDEVVHIVDKRISADSYSCINTIREYGERILEGSGLSSNIEIVTANKKLGGNGPIYANGLKRFGVYITYIGCVGINGIDPIFDELKDGSRMIGVAEPGLTEAIEFLDGKIILSKLDSLNKLTWQDIIAKVDVAELISLFSEARLINLNNWTMIPHMNSIWAYILYEIMPFIHSDKGNIQMFFDLADPRKRTEKDITKALTLIKEFQRTGVRAQLGLNMKEAYLLRKMLGHTLKDIQETTLEELTMALADSLNIDAVVVHSVKQAACFQNKNYCEVDGPYCPAPMLTTGAGDTFNSGFVFGQLQGLALEECLLLGVAASGYYVRNCRSALLEELADFIKNWKANRVV